VAAPRGAPLFMIGVAQVTLHPQRIALKVDWL